MSVNRFNKESNTLTRTADLIIEEKQTFWQGTQAQWEAQDKTKIADGCQVAITDDEPMPYDASEIRYDDDNSVKDALDGMNVATKTPLAFSDSSKYELLTADSAYNNYIVKNGICTVNISLTAKSVTSSNTYVMTDLPQPLNGFVFGTLSAHSTSATDNVQMNIAGDGRLGLRHGTNNVPYLGSISYIVK